MLTGLRQRLDLRAPVEQHHEPGPVRQRVLRRARHELVHPGLRARIQSRQHRVHRHGRDRRADFPGKTRTTCAVTRTTCDCSMYVSFGDFHNFFNFFLQSFKCITQHNTSSDRTSCRRLLRHRARLQADRDGERRRDRHRLQGRVQRPRRRHLRRLHSSVKGLLILLAQFCIPLLGCTAYFTQYRYKLKDRFASSRNLSFEFF